jgi:hypothetical protein
MPEQENVIVPISQDAAQTEVCPEHAAKDKIVAASRALVNRLVALESDKNLKHVITTAEVYGVALNEKLLWVAESRILFQALTELDALAAPKSQQPQNRAKKTDKK